MQLYRARVFDTPDDPFTTTSTFRAGSDVGLLVDAGRITRRGDFAQVHAAHPEAEVVDLREGVLVPGLVDTHVHYPQVRAIGFLGTPLLEWLDRCALPEEVKLGEEAYARAVAREFLDGLRAAGTTSAMVFGSHFASAMDVFFAEAQASGLRLTSGLVTSDRNLPEPLLTTPARATAESRELIARWHGHGRLRFAVTPRFSFSAGEELLAAGGDLVREDPSLWVTTHLNENRDEVKAVAEQFPAARDYLDTYDRAGLLGGRTVLAHNVHPSDAELARMGEAGASVAHCPTSNANLGSGFFPLRRHLEHGVRVALGSDVGAGTGFQLFKEAVQASFLQHLSPSGGYGLRAGHLLYLATAAGAAALDLPEVGDLSEGKRFDAVWVRPTPGLPLDIGLRYATGDEDALAKTLTLGTPGDVAQVWVDGVAVGHGSSSLLDPVPG